MVDKFLEEQITYGRRRQSLVRPYFYFFVDTLERNNILYTAGGGTLLGTIRHGKEIPWDDDYDLYMLEKDIPSLKELDLDHYIPENYDEFYQENGKIICIYSCVIAGKSKYLVISHYSSFIHVYIYDDQKNIVCFVTDIFYENRLNEKRMYPIVKMKFGNMLLPIMNNYHELLCNRYGKDYMEIGHIQNHNISSYYDPKKCNEYKNIDIKKTIDKL